MSVLKRIYQNSFVAFLSMTSYLLMSASHAESFSRHIETSIHIHATPETVWGILTDVSKHSEWNPFIKSISGTVKQGETLKITVHPPTQDPMTFEPEILTCKPNQELRWKGQFMMPGLFDGEHYFRLEQNSDGSTKLIHGENFSGILVYAFYDDLDYTKRGFQLMNTALKKRAESVG